MVLPNVAGQHLRQLAKARAAIGREIRQPVAPVPNLDIAPKVFLPITPARPKEWRGKDHFQLITGPRVDRPFFLIDGKVHPLAGVLLDIVAVK